MPMCNCRRCLKRKYRKKAVGKVASYFDADVMISVYDRSASCCDNLRKDVSNSAKKLRNTLVNSAKKAVSLFSPVFSGRRRRFIYQNDPYLHTCGCDFHKRCRQSMKNHKEMLRKLRVELENKRQGSPAHPQQRRCENTGSNIIRTKLSTIEEELGEPEGS